jgi:hypothetical protein
MAHIVPDTGQRGPLMAADCARLDFHEATDKLIVFAQGA